MSTQRAASTRAPTELHALLTDNAGMPGELWPLGIVGFLAFAGWARLR